MTHDNNEPTCGNCPHRDHESSQCRINPPDKREWIWPIVEQYEWCSRHPERLLALQLAMNDAMQASIKAKARGPGLVIPRPGV